MATDTLHERREDLSNAVLDAHRAYQSLMEELEAVDWYSQRAEATDDEDLQKILLHNRDEELEHACMTLEWIRRTQDGWNDKMKTYLFKKKEIINLEEDHSKKSDYNQSLNVGKIKIRKNNDEYIKTEFSAHNR